MAQRRIAPNYASHDNRDLVTRYRALAADGLAGFAIVQSCLSTAARWGLSTLDALRDLFNGHAWLPPGIEPSG